MKGQFNGNTEKRRPPPHLTSYEVYEMVKDVHVVLGKQKRIGKNIEVDMWMKQSIFGELPYWKNLDVHHSIDVKHIEKNVWEVLLGTLLDTDRNTRDHGYAWAVARWLSKRNGTTHMMHLPFKTWEEGVLWVLEKCESSIRLLDKRLKAYFISRSKVAPSMKSYDYHVLLMQMIAVGIQNILPVNV
jgi:hypothetical protein